MKETFTEISSDKMVLQVKGRTIYPVSTWKYEPPSDIEKIRAVKDLQSKWVESTHE